MVFDNLANLIYLFQEVLLFLLFCFSIYTPNLFLIKLSQNNTLRFLLHYLHLLFLLYFRQNIYNTHLLAPLQQFGSSCNSFCYNFFYANFYCTYLFCNLLFAYKIFFPFLDIAKLTTSSSSFRSSYILNYLSKRICLQCF